MKKQVGTVILAVALFGFVLTGCGLKTETPNSSASASGPKEPETQLIVAGNGATVEEMMKGEIFTRFNKKYPNVKLTYVSGDATSIVAKVKAQMASPQIDVTIIEAGEQEGGRVAGIWEQLKESDIPSLKKVLPLFQVKENSGVAVNYSPIGISYNATLVKEKGLPIPESWNDLTRPEMKGNITIAELTSNFGRSALIGLAYANGGSEKNIGPGFEKLKTIAGYMPTFAKGTPQLQQNLQNKTAVYAVWPMGRSIVQKDAGLELAFVIPKEGTNPNPNVATIVKGAKNPNAAKLFIDFLLSEEVQILYGTKGYYNPSTDVKLPEDTAKMLAFDHSKLKKLDYEVIGNSISDWMDRFNKEIAPNVGK